MDNGDREQALTSVGGEAALEAQGAGDETVATAGIFAVHETKNLAASVAVEVLACTGIRILNHENEDGSAYGRAEGVVGNIPATLEDGEISQCDTIRLRAGGEHGEDGGVHVVLRDTADDDEVI